MKDFFNLKVKYRLTQKDIDEALLKKAPKPVKKTAVMKVSKKK